MTENKHAIGQKADPSMELSSVENRQGQDGTERPPLFSRWRSWYLFVLVILAVLILLFYLFTKHYD